MATWDGSNIEQDGTDPSDSSNLSASVQSWNNQLDSTSAASDMKLDSKECTSQPRNLQTYQTNNHQHNSNNNMQNFYNGNVHYNTDRTNNFHCPTNNSRYHNVMSNSSRMDKRGVGMRRRSMNNPHQKATEKKYQKTYNINSNPYTSRTNRFYESRHTDMPSYEHKNFSPVAPADTHDTVPVNNQFNSKKNFMNRETRNNHSHSNRAGYTRNNNSERNGHVPNKKSTNWRKTGRKEEWFYNKKYEPDDDAGQRVRLTELLNRGILECLVCCDHIKQNDYIWSCKNCFHVLHLSCIRKWATSSQSVESQWRCPACQNVSSEIPEDYECFCGKTKAPEWNRRDTAHSCGETCGRSKPNCAHKCTLLCHPGSCPTCNIMTAKSCGCGKMTLTQMCSSGPVLVCDEICGNILNCKLHYCQKKCHHGECEPCTQTVVQECFCGKNKLEAVCVQNLSKNYSCMTKCLKTLECGNHTCQDICHEGPCQSCKLTPENITSCCCGQTPITVKRNSCLDPIPVCDKICSKALKCGQPSDPHTCQSTCHQNECPVCKLTTKVKCRCGHMDKELACSELKSKADDARCEKKCTKKRSCGKHKCNQMCCIDIEHICPLPCSKYLSCGKHKCEQTCHKGRCLTCWRSSFDELFCECGSSVIYPPVPCGTKRPACEKPCSREHACSHQVFHNCHSDVSCPPCTVLTERWCYGEHVLRKAVPCYVQEISCGRPCNKPLLCGNHKCIMICHTGPCEQPGQICLQPCTIPRNLCGHDCAAPCHKDKCTDTPCKEMVKVTCLCGHRSMMRVCAENSRDYQRIAGGILASKMAEMQLGHHVDLEQVFGNKKLNQLKTLECNEECKIIERNRRLTLGLQIVNPDLSGKILPRYSDYMKLWAKKDPALCLMVHDRLTELVQLAKTSKQKSRSYSFEVMNRDKRHFVHEYCEHFGCESQAYDQEPKRNVVATAVKDKCWLPSYSLMEMIKRESGQRKVPGPVTNNTKLHNAERTMNSLLSQSNWTRKANPPESSKKSVEPEIDYFNYNG